MSRALALRHAAEELAADRALWCVTCDALAEEGGRHCLSCRLYWEDCRNGLYDDTFPEDEIPT